jgi:hypothetical protein
MQEAGLAHLLENARAIGITALNYDWYFDVF